PVAIPERRVAQAAPDARDVTWVAAHDHRRQAPLDDEGHGEGGLLAARDRLAPAHEPVVGLDADEGQRADLAVVVRLRIANGERLDAAYSHGPSLGLGRGRRAGGPLDNAPILPRRRSRPRRAVLTPPTPNFMIVLPIGPATRRGCPRRSLRRLRHLRGTGRCSADTSAIWRPATCSRRSSTSSPRSWPASTRTASRSTASGSTRLALPAGDRCGRRP